MFKAVRTGKILGIRKYQRKLLNSIFYIVRKLHVLSLLSSSLPFSFQWEVWVKVGTPILMLFILLLTGLPLEETIKNIQKLKAWHYDKEIC